MKDDRPVHKGSNGEAAIEEQERYEALERLEEWLDGPVEVLGLVWLVLLVVEFVWGLNPFLDALVYVIWAIFILDFAIRLALAPHKKAFLGRSWLTVLSLALPALRVFAVLRAARLVRLVRSLRGLRLVRLVGSLNRGMRTLQAYLGRRKFGYVLALTVIITLSGAAGMLALEREGLVENGFDGYGDALWWTAMVMTTLGSEYWPKTAEGRVLAFLLSVYALSVFGYVTATLATYFIGREAATPASDVAGAEPLHALETRIEALHAEVRALSQGTRGPGGGERTGL